MTSFSTAGILLRRIDLGDYDLILTFLTPDRGKISAVAKNAKKSIKRFSGILELFSILEIVCQKGRGKLPILKEAALQQPHYSIREDIGKTAYASYLVEIINTWVEEGKPQESLYYLLKYSLGVLNHGNVLNEELSILFQMRFLTLSGLSPNLTQCCNCKTDLDNLDDKSTIVDLKKGGLVCENCSDSGSYGKTLSKGTVKQLLWVTDGDLEKAGRIRFTKQAIMEGLAFLEAFVSFHMGRDLKSLKFLKDIRHGH